MRPSFHTWAFSVNLRLHKLLETIGELSMNSKTLKPSNGRAHPKKPCNDELNDSLEFLEEARVVLEVHAEVLDLPLQHRDALDAHSECES